MVNFNPRLSVARTIVHASLCILLLASGARWLGAALTYPVICAIGLYAFLALLTIGPAILPAAALLVVATTAVSADADNGASRDP